jgi:hypothetical protein
MINSEFETAQASVAPFATESLVLSGIIPAERLSVLRSARNVTRLAGKTIEMALPMSASLTTSRL